jgi:hypothetical protein
MPWRLCTPPEGHFDALKGIYVRKHTDLTWSSGADLRLQYGDSADRMRHRNALVSIARQRHLDRRSSCCPDGHARYAYWVDICVLIPPPVPEGTTESIAALKSAFGNLVWPTPGTLGLRGYAVNLQPIEKEKTGAIYFKLDVTSMF